jgi:GntR family transcriptional repressor for pyruvate dehydrogenase complex
VVRHRPESPRQGTLADLDRRRAALLDSLTFRRVVEPGACHLAASRRLGEDHRHLLLTALKEVSGAPDAAAHRQADARLHLALATVTESPLVVEAVTRCQADLHEMLSAIPVLEVNIEHSSAQHEAIVEAVLAGAAGRARRVMEAHCDDTAALLRRLLG